MADLVSVKSDFGDSIEKAVDNILESAGYAVDLASKEAAKLSAQEAVKKLRVRSPKRSGAYAKGWKVKYVNGAYVVHNAKHYQLTHLLENGHDVVSHGKKVGHFAGIPHIKPIEQEEIEVFEEKVIKLVEERIGNAK